MTSATVFIPTHNRPRYLKRSLEYWQQFNYEIVVADSSEKAYSGQVPECCSYLHMPNYEYFEKCQAAISTIKSECLIPCPDDDFHTFHGIMTSLNILQADSQSMTAKGRSIDFIFKGKEIESYSIHANERDVTSKQIEVRMQEALFPWVTNSWSTFRIDIYRTCIDVVVELKSPWSRINAFELSTSLIPSIFGHIKVSDVFHTAREVLPRWEGFPHDEQKAQSVDAWVSEKGKDYLKWRDSVIDLSVNRFPSLELATNSFDQALEYFLNGFIEKNERKKKIVPKTVKTRIIDIAPNRVLGLYRRMRYKKRIIKTGYPWLDETSKNDWKNIHLVLQKHGNLEGVGGEVVRI